MENQRNQPLHHNFEYVQGQIAGLKAMVIALAAMQPTDEFLSQFDERLEALRTALLGEPVSDLRLAALDHLEGEVRTIFGA